MCNLCWTDSRYHKVDLASSLCLTARQLSDYEQELLVPFLQIPIEAGRVFRREAGQRSDMKPATIPN